MMRLFAIVPILVLLFGTRAQAAMITYVYEDGGDLIVESSGYLSLSQWTYSGSDLANPGIGYFRPHVVDDPSLPGDVWLGWLEGAGDYYFALDHNKNATGDRPLSPIPSPIKSESQQTTIGSGNFFVHLGPGSYIRVASG